jgi:leader peptidase (prepilin peptidase)/N-methyltransferase
MLFSRSRSFTEAGWMAINVIEPALHAVILGCLAWASWVDMRSLKLPDALTATIAVAALLLAVLFSRVSPVSAVLGMLLAGGLTLICAIVASRRAGMQAMGGGDVKLAAAIGAWVGALDVSWMLLCAALIGLTVFAVKAATGADGARRIIPFGPCLAIAGIAVAVIAPSQWLHRYMVGAGPL